MKLKYGTYRLVVVTDKFAIKIASPHGGQKSFIYGLYSNIRERERYRNTEDARLAVSYWCSFMGLIQIQKSYVPLQRDLTDEEIKLFEDVHHGDYKKENFGTECGKLICLDYTMPEIYEIKCFPLLEEDLTAITPEQELQEGEHWAHEVPDGYVLEEEEENV